MRTYIDEVNRLLCMLLRDTRNIFTFDLPLSVAQALQALQDGLVDDQISDVDLMYLVHQLLMSLWTQHWPQDVETKFTTDPTMLFLAFRMIIPSGGFREPNQTSPVVARITYCQRLVFVLELLKNHDQPNYNASTECDRLEQYFTEKNDYTFNSLRSLQHLASTLAIKQKSLPRVVWLDRKQWDHMLYLGDSIKFADLCQVFHNIEQELVPLWEDKIMLGTKLSIDIHSALLCDDLTRKLPPYSMFKDPRNTCLHTRSALFRAIVSTPALRDQFIVGIDMANNTPRWNKVALRSWLYQYSRFNLLLMLRWEMLAGSPTRGTEMVSMLAQNTQTRPRNLYAIGPNIALVGQYHKSGAISGSDKLLPRAGDAFTADLTIQNLALARPFAQFIATVCYPNDPKVIEAYRDLLFPNMGRAFDSDELSDAMAKYSHQVLNVRLGLNAFRHVSIAFRRMLVDQATEQETDNEIIRHVEAEQAGHSEHVEQTIYAVSLDSIGEYSDQMLGVFCDASARWQIKCGIVPTGVSRSYREATAACYQDLRSKGLFAVDEFTTAESRTRALLADVKDFIKSSMTAATEDIATSLLNKLQPLLLQQQSSSTSATVVTTPPRPPPLVTTFSPTRQPTKRRGTVSIVVDSSPTKKGREFSPELSDLEEEQIRSFTKPSTLQCKFM
ncbi:hypothetical protein HHX47_DHR6000789, partial [Lentinula edodes]